MALISLGGRVLDANAALGETLGQPPEQVVGRTLQEVADLDLFGSDPVCLSRLVTGESSSCVMEARCRHSDGHRFWALVSVSLSRDESGEPLHLIAQIQDISEQKDLEERLKRLADEDPLTGLFNRRRFEEELEQRIAWVQRYGEGGAVMLVDLDGLKAVNDTFGHRHGDELIQGIAGVLRDRLRRTDVMARLGGDEFAVLLPEVDVERARMLGEEMLAAIRRHRLRVEGQQVRTTASVGVVLFDGRDEVGAADLLADADVAMYEAKRTGRNRLVVRSRPRYDRGPRLPRLAVDWPDQLSEVLGSPDAPGVAFQPIIDLERGVAAGYEALARFDDAPGGPQTWFAAAARHGFTPRLEAAALRRTVARRAELPESCFLAVNLSPEALAAPEVREVLREHGDLGGLVIELTEQTRIRDYDALAEALAPWRAAGAMLAVDEGGEGYSSLRQVMALRPEFVKLDRALLSNVDRDEAKAAAIEALGTLADRMDAWLVAEGVERLEEVDALVRLRVPMAQGFAIASPAPTMEAVPAELTERVRALGGMRRAGPGVFALLDRLEPALTTAGGEEVAERLAADPDLDFLPLCDEDGRPVGIVRRPTSPGMAPAVTPPMRIDVTSSISEVARRAMTRPPEERFTPLICTDARGRYLGLLRVERLVEALTG